METLHCTLSPTHWGQLPISQDTNFRYFRIYVVFLHFSANQLEICYHFQPKCERHEMKFFSVEHIRAQRIWSINEFCPSRRITKPLLRASVDTGDGISIAYNVHMARTAISIYLRHILVTTTPNTLRPCSCMQKFALAKLYTYDINVHLTT